MIIFLFPPTSKRRKIYWWVYKRTSKIKLSVRYTALPWLQKRKTQQRALFKMSSNTDSVSHEPLGFLYPPHNSICLHGHSQDHIIWLRKLLKQASYHRNAKWPLKIVFYRLQSYCSVYFLLHSIIKDKNHFGDFQM